MREPSKGWTKLFTQSQLTGKLCTCMGTPRRAKLKAKANADLRTG